MSSRVAGFVARRPVAVYFLVTFAVSWSGALLVAAPHLLRGEPLPTMTGIVMFPAMLIGPSLSGILLTRMIDGPSGLGALFSRMSLARIGLRWYPALLLPPIVILTLLLVLAAFVSPAYSPNRFFMGILFGIPAGILEEIGWTGFAFPKMRSPENGLTPAILLGLVWSLWHLPVINFLGAVVPHGAYWLPFFLAFATAMTAMRVLIAWMYSNTKSVALAQLMHISSTGSLVILSPRVTAGQEAAWYALYGIALWACVSTVATVVGKRLYR